MSAFTTQRATQMANALKALDDLSRENGLRVGSQYGQGALVDADGTVVCRVDYDVELGQHVAVVE